MLYCTIIPVSDKAPQREDAWRCGGVTALLTLYVGEGSASLPGRLTPAEITLLPLDISVFSTSVGSKAVERSKASARGGN